MYTLYGSPGSGSASVEAALVEIGTPFENFAIITKNGDHLEPTFSAINPRQQVPALRLPDGSVMTEGAAMMLHLADAFPEARLAPPPGSSARAQHDRWLIFMAVNVYEGELRKNYADRYSSDPNGAEAVQRAADTYVKRHYDILESAMGKGPYFFGDQYTMLDIYIWMLVFWMDWTWLSEHCPKISALALAVSRRPAINSVHAIHNG